MKNWHEYKIEQYLSEASSPDAAALAAQIKGPLAQVHRIITSSPAARQLEPHFMQLVKGLGFNPVNSAQQANGSVPPNQPNAINAQNAGNVANAANTGNAQNAANNPNAVPSQGRLRAMLAQLPRQLPGVDVSALSNHPNLIRELVAIVTLKNPHGQAENPEIGKKLALLVNKNKNMLDQWEQLAQAGRKAELWKIWQPQLGI